MADPKTSAAALAETLVPAAVRALKAYHVAPSAGLIKLDAMENPYPWPTKMREAWAREVASLPVNRYPDAGAHELKAAMREKLGIPAHVGLLLGNGSDELIQLLVMCLGGPGRVVLAPDPTFVMYRLLTTALGGEFVGVPLRPDDFSLDLDVTLEAIRRHRPSLVFLAYPNNPTGNLFPRDDVEAVVRAAPGLVVVDEAYEPFARASFLDRLDAFPNLVVMRTLSKVGLAGLRLGYLMGDPAWIGELDKVRLPYNINSLSQACARFALTHYPEFQSQAARILEERAVLYQGLARFPALKVWPSEANFLLCRLEGGNARELAGALEARGVLVRLLDGSAPSLAGCLRVSVGTPQENATLLDALDACLAAS